MLCVKLQINQTTLGSKFIDKQCKMKATEEDRIMYR